MDDSDSGSLAIAALDAQSSARAALLAAQLNLDCVDLGGGGWRLCGTHALLLLVSERGLELARTGAGRELPVRADFAAPDLLHRIRHGSARREDLARAIGLPAPRRLRVVDATAGLGRDSAVLAALGCQMILLERQPVVAALLHDALERARASEDATVRALAARMELHAGDARELLQGWSPDAPDTVLLDPMFPDRDSSAAVRKEMRLFQDLVGADEDAPELLAAALAIARHRVVVKRPLAAPPLAGPSPTHSLRGRSTRFDVYAKARIS